MEDIWNRVIWGNAIQHYVIAALCIFAAWVALKLIKYRLLVFLKELALRSNSHLDDTFIKITERFLIPYVYLLINYQVISQLRLSARGERIIDAAFMVVTMYFAVRLINFFLQGSVVKFMERKQEPPERIKQVSGMLNVVKALIWCVGLVMLADNMGYDVTTVIAGLGVGGIAIALAAQNILGDLFSYFVIFFDKPFEIGDFIVVDKHSGVVEKIGIKTSHVRSPDGQQLILPNAEMVKTVIHNFKRLRRRRVVLRIGVVYNTPSAVLRSIPAMVETIIIQQEDASFDRAHFVEFGDFSVNFEIVYFIESADYLLYMNIQQDICLNILEKFEKEKIEFAFPTQTLFVNSQVPEKTGDGQPGQQTINDDKFGI